MGRMIVNHIGPLSGPELHDVQADKGKANMAFIQNMLPLMSTGPLLYV